MSVDIPAESLNHLHAMSSSNNLVGMHSSAGLVGTVTYRGASQGVSQEEAEELLAFLEEQEKGGQSSLSASERRAIFALRRIAGCVPPAAWHALGLAGSLLGRPQLALGSAESAALLRISRRLLLARA